MCYTYDKSKGGDTRELQSRMVPPPKKTGSSHLKNTTKHYPNKFLCMLFRLQPQKIYKINIAMNAF